MESTSIFDWLLSICLSYMLILMYIIGGDFCLGEYHMLDLLARLLQSRHHIIVVLFHLLKFIVNVVRGLLVDVPFLLRLAT